MSDPRKLIDDTPDDLTGNLLRSALDDGPSPRALHKTATALGVAGLVATGTTKVAGAAAGAKVGVKFGGMMMLKWFGVGASAGVLIAGSAEIARRNQEPVRQLQPAG